MGWSVNDLATGLQAVETPGTLPRPRVRAAAGPAAVLVASLGASLLVASFLVASVLVASGTARADEPDGAARSEAAEVAPSEPPPDRRVPDYDGRPDPAPSAGEVLLWVPRVLFSPFYLVSEYLLRRPLGFVATEIEQGGGRWLLAIFDVRGESPYGIVPTAYFEFGFRANVGLYVFVDDLFTEGDHYRIHAATGGTDYWKITTVTRIPFHPSGAALGLRLHASRREDYLFAGFGYDSDASDRVRYGTERFGGRLELRMPYWASSRVEVSMGVEDVDYYDGDCCGDPSLLAGVEAGTLTNTPPGWETGFTVWRQRLEVSVDSRRHVADDGFRIEAHAEQAVDFSDPLDQRWLHWGGRAGLFFPAPGRRRTASLALGAWFVDPVGDGQVPFSEQALLEGERLRGFRRGRLHGRSALAIHFEYQWPIWIWLGGVMQVGVGNAYGPHLDDFELDTLRGSGAIGLRTTGKPDHVFQILVAAGTEPIREGFGVTSVRFVVGAQEGF